MVIFDAQPFNEAYQWFNTSSNLIIPDTTNSFMNTYLGGAFQQATSVVTENSKFLFVEKQTTVCSSFQIKVVTNSQANASRPTVSNMFQVNTSRNFMEFLSTSKYLCYTGFDNAVRPKIRQFG